MFTRAGYGRLTSPTRGAARSQGCRRGFPRLPRAPGTGKSSWKEVPAGDTEPEAQAHAAPHRVALSQALRTLGLVTLCPRGARPTGRPAAWPVRASLGQNKGLGRSGVPACSDLAWLFLVLCL